MSNVNQNSNLPAVMGDECLPPWLKTMRAAARAGVNEADVEEIVKNQVVKAKQGDQAAIKFVFEQVLGAGPLKGATFVQNNTFNDGIVPEQPTLAPPGSRKKVDVLAKRYRAGADTIFNNGDADHSGRIEEE